MDRKQTQLRGIRIVPVRRLPHQQRMHDRLPYVYILASQKRGTLYIGVTSDLPGRIWQHRNGSTRGFTSRYGVYRLVHAEAFDDMYSAIAREKQLKRWHRAWKIALIEQTNADWSDLATEWKIAEPLPGKPASSP